MDVLLVEPKGHEPGHSAMYVRRLAISLQERDHNVTIVTSKGLKREWVKKTNINHLPWASENNKRYKNKYSSILEDKYKVYKTYEYAYIISKEESFDAVHFLGDWYPRILTYILYRYDINNATVTIGSELKSMGKVWREASSLKELVGNTTRNIARRKLVDTCNVVIHSEHIFEDVERSNDDNEIAVIPWGMDKIDSKTSQSEARQAIGLQSETPALLLFGNIRQDKGYEFFFDAISDVEEPFTIIVAGSPVNVDIKDVIQQNGLSDITLVNTEYIPEESVPLYFHAADGVVLPYRKGFLRASGVLFHACEYGCPLIACDQGQIGSYVNKWGLGVSFKPENEEELQKAVKSFVTSSSSRLNEYKQNIQKFVESNTWNRVAKKHIESYKRCLSR